MTVYTLEVSPDAAPWTVRILHISDTQFGQYHRFTTGEASLSARLISDLLENGQEFLPIDLLVVTGDIAETSSPNEYQEAQRFLVELVTNLSINRDRVIMIPGNHDVNWDLSDAQAAADRAWGTSRNLNDWQQKHDVYKQFAEAFYGRSVQSTHGTQHFPELDLTVVKLDSTKQESREAHFGHCGEEQYKSLAREVSESRARFKVGIVHHNARRQLLQDDENLRDADDLGRILGPHLDLLLHGHTHDGRSDRLPDGTVVFSAGSAGISADFRPTEVGNQYQVIEISDGLFRRWARRYEPVEKRWVADSRASQDGSSGIEMVPRDPRSPNAALSEGLRSSIEEGGTQYDPGKYQFYVSSLPDEMKSRSATQSPEKTLAELGVWTGNSLTPLGVLLFGIEPRLLWPSAVIQFSSFRGASENSHSETRVITGSPLQQVHVCYSELLSRMSRRDVVKPGQIGSDTMYEYPTVCLREVLSNAVVHRNYGDTARSVQVRMFSDRIEVWSPGAWIGHEDLAEGVSFRKLKGASIRRNPELAVIMSHVKFFEGAGTGVVRAAQDAVLRGAPAPHARFEQGFVVVSIFPSNEHSALSLLHTLGTSWAGNSPLFQDVAEVVGLDADLVTESRCLVLWGTELSHKIKLAKALAVELALQQWSIVHLTGSAFEGGRMKRGLLSWLCSISEEHGLAIDSEDWDGLLGESNLCVIAEAGAFSGADAQFIVTELENATDRYPDLRVIVNVLEAPKARAKRTTMLASQDWVWDEVRLGQLRRVGRPEGESEGPGTPPQSFFSGGDDWI